MRTKFKNKIHPLILVSRTPHHERSKVTECRQFDSVNVCACVKGLPDEHLVYGFYTHDYLLPN